jgi:hypothetical protein
MASGRLRTVIVPKKLCDGVVDGGHRETELVGDLLVGRGLEHVTLHTGGQRLGHADRVSESREHDRFAARRSLGDAECRFDAA